LESKEDQSPEQDQRILVTVHRGVKQFCIDRPPSDGILPMLKGKPTLKLKTEPIHHALSTPVSRCVDVVFGHRH
jgi:hypothetical protein